MAVNRLVKTGSFGISGLASVDGSIEVVGDVLAEGSGVWSFSGREGGQGAISLGQGMDSVC